MQTCILIALNLGTHKEHIKVNSCTKFAMNLTNIHGVMNVSLCKNQTFVKATGKLHMGIV